MIERPRFFTTIIIISWFSWYPTVLSVDTYLVPPEPRAQLLMYLMSLPIAIVSGIVLYGRLDTAGRFALFAFTSILISIAIGLIVRFIPVVVLEMSLLGRVVLTFIAVSISYGGGYYTTYVAEANPMGLL